MRLLVRVASLIGVTLVAPSADLVEAQTVNPCIGKKLVCVSALAVAHDRCYAKAAKAGAALDPACTQKARDKFAGPKGCIAKSERKAGCLTSGDANALAGVVEGFVGELVAALDPDFPTGLKNKCTAGKHGCVASKVKALLQCHVKAAKKGVLDATCTAKAMAKFDGGSKPAKACFTKLEQKGGCVTTGDRDALETVADDFVRTVSCALDAAAPACALATATPPAGTTPTGSVPAGTTATPTPSPSPSPETLPPDATTIAPPVDAGVAAAIADATAFLYTGADPIQTGVAPGTIEPTRVAVLRGRVLTRAGQPLPDVAVTILGHPELGQTLTRANGVFDLAVNGGGELVVTYGRTGFLPVQRQIRAPWQDYAILPDVVLIPLDAQVTAVDLTAGTAMQVARGGMVTDADGSRRATVMFPQGATATMVFSNGSTQPLTALSVRATEYTVGANGPAAMPAELPATSGYTYCAELSIDEALAAGAADVQFSVPLPFYVENFLGFPVGMDVPLGSYDRRRGAWIPEANGKVIQIVGVTGNKADVDSDGDGTADAALAMSDAERQQLATLYAPGQSLQRMLVTHFTPYDANMPVVPPPDAIFPEDDPEPDAPLDEPCTQSGNSVIECQNQILGEAIRVVGTGMDLHYQSDRTAGYLAANTLEIPLSRGALPASILGIELEIEVAGRRFLRFFPAAPNQRATFTWDGKDAYGRVLDGPQPITVSVHYVYPAVYSQTTRFAAPASSAVTVVPSRDRVKLTRIAPLVIGTFHATSAGLGGWSVSPHHAYVPATQTLYRGDGRRESANAKDALGPIITAVTAPAGGCFSMGIGGPAIDKHVCGEGIAVGPDGSLYIAAFDERVYRVGPDGNITVAAGDGTTCAASTDPCGDGGSATAAQLKRPWSVAAGPDGSVYIGDLFGQRIRKVDPTGTITTVVGTGIACPSVFSPCGDGGPGTLAQIHDPLSLAVGPDGALYIADTFDNRIRRLGPDGIITTVAGTGNGCAVLPSTPPPFCGEGGPATEAALSQPGSVSVGRDGSIYIVDGGARVRRVTPDGIIRTIAGRFNGSFVPGNFADGIPAAGASVDPSAVAVGPDDTVYVATGNDHRIRSFRPGGVITTIAGSRDASGSAGDGGPARRATLEALGNNAGLALAPDGSIYVAEQPGGAFSYVRRIAPIGERFVNGELVVPAVDGSEVYVFTPAGQHLRTVDALTGTPLYAFTYDPAGRLATITDRSDNVTTVERDPQGTPTGILGPFGQRTLLDLDANGYLSAVIDPADETMQLGHTAGGLLTSVTHPGSQTSEYGYDALGRLTSATDPTNATKTLVRSGTNKDHTVTVTTALGRASTYRAARLSNGDVQATSTDASGVAASAVIGQDGRSTLTDRNGTMLSIELGADPRWGMRAPIQSSVIVKTPGGLTRTLTRQRTVALVGGALLNVASLTDTATVNGRAATATYDGATRTLTTTFPTGRQTKAVFDAHARLVQAQTGNLEPTDVGYDAQGRLATVATGPVGNRRITTLAYASNGFLKSVTDPLDRTFSLTKDAVGRSTQVALSSSAALGLTYDANGFVDSLTPPGRPSHGFGYSARNEPTSYTAPAVGNENRQTLVVYDADRKPTEVHRADGVTTGFGYDTGGRLNLLDLATRQQTFGYDAAGRISAVSTSEAVGLAYTYDGGLASSLTWSGPVSGSVTRTRDADFRVASLSVNGANPIAIQYDADGSPTQVGSLVLTRQAQTGLRTGSTLGLLSDTIGYDGFGIPAAYAATHDGTGVYSASFTRDKNDRLTSRSETIGGTTRVFGYTYDADGRLTEVREDGVLTATYTYDANGNRLSFDDGGGTVSASYDAQDRLVTRGAATYAYAPSGELLSKTVGGQVTTFDYDGGGNLTGVTLPNATAIEYLIDGRGRRVGKQVNGTLVQGLLYQDVLRPIAELDGAGAVVSRFVYAGNGTVPAYMVKAGVTYRILTDNSGSPRLVVDVASGQTVQRMDYDEFGNVVLDTNPGFQPFGFAGGLYDALTGLVHFGAREYDAEAGRWTTKDPGGFSGGPNLYAYVFDDPINLVDPSGKGPIRISFFPYEAAPPPGNYIPAAPAAPPPPAPPPPPAAPPPVSPTVRVAPYPVYEVPVAAEGTGTAVARCPLVARIGGPLLAFAAGYAAGTAITKATDVDETAADTGQNAKQFYVDAGFPEWLAEINGLTTTFAVANGGPLGFVLGEIFD